MSEARELVHQCGLPAVPVAKAINDLDVRLVMHVHQKKASSRVAFANQADIAVACYDALKVIAKDFRLQILECNSR